MLLTVDLERLRVRAGETLLDAGCGEGRHCFGALERGARVVGLDLDRATLSRARRARCASAPRELGSLGAMLQGDTFALPFRDASFDKVICSEVMEHVHDYRAAARELARVTRPRGLVAVTIPTAISENLYLRARRRLLRIARAATSASSGRASSRAGSPRPGSRRWASASPTRCTRRTGRCARSPACRARTSSRLVRAYRRFLIRATVSPAIARLERVLDYCFPEEPDPVRGEARHRPRLGSTDVSAAAAARSASSPTAAT